MTAGGELRLLVLGHTCEGINYIIELSISELGKPQNGFPITILGNDLKGVDSRYLISGMFRVRVCLFDYCNNKI